MNEGVECAAFFCVTTRSQEPPRDTGSVAGDTLEMAQVSRGTYSLWIRPLRAPWCDVQHCGYNLLFEVEPIITYVHGSLGTMP